MNKHLIPAVLAAADILAAVVIDPCAGSGSALRAAAELGRRAFGFEIKKNFFETAKEKMLGAFQPSLAL